MKYSAKFDGNKNSPFNGDLNSCVSASVTLEWNLVCFSL